MECPTRLILRGEKLVVKLLASGDAVRECTSAWVRRESTPVAGRRFSYLATGVCHKNFPCLLCDSLLLDKRHPLCSHLVVDHSRDRGCISVKQLKILSSRGIIDGKTDGTAPDRHVALVRGCCAADHEALSVFRSRGHGLDALRPTCHSAEHRRLVFSWSLDTSATFELMPFFLSLSGALCVLCSRQARVPWVCCSGPMFLTSLRVRVLPSDQR